jgi:NitT/TauT family transport system permease protein
MNGFRKKIQPLKPLQAALLFGAALVFWLLIWQIIAINVQLSLLLPTPKETFQTLGRILLQANFWRVTLSSLLRIFGGFSLAVFIGCLLGSLTAFLPILRPFVALPMNIIKATPVASFVILALVWLSSQQLSLFICFLMVLPLVWSNVETGLLQVDQSLLEMAWTYKLTPVTVLKTIYLPAVRPFFVNALLLGFGYAWKSGVAAEVLGLPVWGIGTKLYQAKIYLETPELFAWTLVVIAISLLAEYLLAFWLKKERRN